MADAKLKLVYFDFKGRGAVTRLLLHAGGKEFTEQLVEGKDWPALKPKTPFGQLPLLDIDGKLEPQSHAMNRYLADELGLGGRTRLESFRCDQLAGVFEDVLQKCASVVFEKDEKVKAEKTENLRETFGIPIQQQLERWLKETGTGYFVGDRLTLGDIYVFDLHTGTFAPFFGPVDKLPLLKANIEKVKNHPKIAAHLSKDKYRTTLF